jgi:hypothetical protein
MRGVRQPHVERDAPQSTHVPKYLGWQHPIAATVQKTLSVERTVHKPCPQLPQGRELAPIL